jgi:hypothetical protein
MKKILFDLNFLILTLFTGLSPLFSMDPEKKYSTPISSQGIPQAEKLVSQLLPKEQNLNKPILMDLLKKLQRLANILYWQDYYIKKEEEYTIRSKKIQELIEEQDQISQSTFSAQCYQYQKGRLYAFEPNSPELINIYLTHYDLFKNYNYTKPQEEKLKKLLPQWLSSQDKEVKSLGEFQNINYLIYEKNKLQKLVTKEILNIITKLSEGELHYIYCFCKNESENSIINPFFNHLLTAFNIRKLYIDYLYKQSEKNLLIDKNEKEDSDFFKDISACIENYNKNREIFYTTYKLILEKIKTYQDQLIKISEKEFQSLKNPKIAAFKKYGICLRFMVSQPNASENNKLDVKSNQKDLPAELFEIQKTKINRTESKQEKNNPTQKKQHKKSINQKIQCPKENDGSTVLEETEDYILIDDPKNTIKIKLFKTEKSNFTPTTIFQKYPLSYTPWVNKWFEDPKQALKEQGYYDIQNTLKYSPTTEKERKVTTLHAFAKIVDKYIPLYGKMQKIENKNKKQQDILITMPGIVFCNSKNQWQSGLFTYIIDSNNKSWYHRNFTARKGKDLIEEYYQKGFYEIEFPDLDSIN